MYAPNFLAYFNPRAPWGCSTVLVAIALGLAYTGLLMFVPSLAVLLLVLVFVSVFAFKAEWGLVAIVSTAFFSGLMVDFSEYAWAREVPGLATLNAPLVDFLAMAVAAGLGLAWLLRLPAWTKGSWTWPGWQWYGVFLVCAGISAQFTYDHDVGQAWYQWLRPLLFVYLLYVVMVQRLVTTPTIWLRVAKIWFGLGLLVSAYGLVSLFVTTAQGWVRAVPFPIFGFTPLGINHNLLAEPLVAIIPVSIWLAWYYRRRDFYRWLVSGVGLMTFVCLLTLSRAAWLSLGVQMVIVGWLYRQQIVVKIKQLVPEFKVVLACVGVAVLGYMVYFLSSNVVSSSSGARWEVTEIAGAYASVKPWFGYGPGTFVELLAGSYIYTLEYGEALDAHGFGQKVMVEFGLFGLVTFVGFLGWVIKHLFKRVREDVFYQALLCMVAGAIVFQLFNTSYFSSVMWLPIGLALTGTQFSKRH